VLLDEAAAKVVAQGADGSFCLLPQHRDIVSALTPGILTYATPEGAERFVAVDEGVLVKHGPEVRVATRQAVAGAELGQLRRAVAEQFRALSERDREARAALARLEADFLRQVVSWEDRTRG
jgi:F-type H+-transporting ATPase subunit epsilon